MSRAAERGFVTAMLVLLIVVMLLFAFVTLFTTTSSNITDTRARGDATEALPLAESGIEREAARFASGTACDAAALAEPAVAFGRGHFRLLSAALVANACRLRVRGTMGLAQRTVEADAATFLYEPFPAAYAVPARLNAVWPETVIKKKGASGYDTAGALADGSGSLRAATNTGKNNKFEAFRRRTLPAAIVGPQAVTLELSYKMNYRGAAPKVQRVQVRLVDTAGVAHPFAGADFPGPSKANTWIASGILPDTIAAGVTIDRIELYYTLANGNAASAKTWVWIDNVRLTTSAAGYRLRAWTELSH